jgi:hypothetical protein
MYVSFRNVARRFVYAIVRVDSVELVDSVDVVSDCVVELAREDFVKDVQGVDLQKFVREQAAG